MKDTGNVSTLLKKAKQPQHLHPLDILRRCDAAILLNPNVALAHYNRGFALHSLKRFHEAIQSYDRAIELNPDLAEAHYNRGDTLRKLKRLDEALRSYDCAIELKSDYAVAFNNRGNVLKELHRLDEALQSYNRAAELIPDDPLAYYNRGNILQELGRLDEALQNYARAVELKPDFADAYYNHGNALRRLNRFEEALRSYDHAVELKPDYAPAHNSRGAALRELRRPDEALRSCDKAVGLKVDFAEAYYNRGNALQDLKRMDKALRNYDRAIELKPDYADAYNNRGNALRSLDRVTDAVQNFDRAVEIKPRFAEAHYNKGNAFKSLGHLDDAIQSYDGAIDLKTDFAEAHWNKSLCLLMMGNFEEGWRLYEWRKRRAEPLGFRTYPQPEWSGRENIEGKTLFVHAEQGLGDTIQFCRYAIMAEATGAKVILAVQDRLTRLLKDLSSSIQIVGLATTPSDFDYHISLLSMPLAFQANPRNISDKVPYLRAESDGIAAWKDRIGDAGFKIGICWQGAKAGDIDAGRSLPVSHFAGLATIANVRLISLQKNDGVEQLLDLPDGMKVETLGDDFDAGRDGFIDTAAVMESMDLVITSDTAIAHLAGALGRPAWVVLKQIPDWRWFLDRSDSPWYPSIRLFRQTKRNNWSGVFAAMEAQLTERLAQRSL